MNVTIGESICIICLKTTYFNNHIFEHILTVTLRDYHYRYTSSVTVMLVAKKYAGVIFLHVDDISIVHQYHNMPEYDVGDRYAMFIFN